jgi:steroid 5-alpha reductase family enzyme
MKRDKRFDGMRESFFRFLKFWVLQGLAVWVILIPALFFINSNLTEVMWVGFIIWALGLILESTADFQKYNFKQNEKNKDRFIQSGIWKYSRHPNYFGEILCWVGIYIFVFASLTSLQKIVSLASPLFIIILLLFVTGLPPLEKYADKKWGKQKDYQEYKRKTSILIPWIPKR